MSETIQLLNKRKHAPEKARPGFVFAASIIADRDTVFDYLQTLEACYENDGIALQHRNHQQEIIGHALAYRFEPGSEVVGLQGVAVHPEHRGAGVGANLVRLLGRCSVDLLEAEGFLLNPTAGARHWYERFGFEPQDEFYSQLYVDAQTFKTTAANAS